MFLNIKQWLMLFVVLTSAITSMDTHAASWTEMSSPDPFDLRSIWGSSSTDVYVVGQYGKILHYDGNPAGTWSYITSGTANNLRGIWGASATDIFAVGDAGTILHYDGSWSTMVSGTSSALYCVWGSSGNDVFAVGDAGTIRHYNGSTWEPMTSGTTNLIRGVWGSAGNNVFAVCFSGTILHYNGTNWTPMVSGTFENLSGVWGSAGNNVFATGASGKILHYDGNGNNDGTPDLIWEPMTSKTSQWVVSVWGHSSTDVFGVGFGGVILHYDGDGNNDGTPDLIWEEMRSGDPYNYSNYAVWGSSGINVFCASLAGHILHYAPSTEDCSNGIDDDGDTLIDCEDPDCDGRSCNDDLFCNGTDTCSEGACSIHAGDPCFPYSCDEDHGICLGGPEICDDGIDNDLDSHIDCEDPDCDGQACDDGITCTENDTCSGFLCGGTPNDALCNDSNPCTDDICNPSSGCTHTNNTNPCDDRLFCNGEDICSNGICGHSGDPCVSPLVCNEALDQCGKAPAYWGKVDTDYDFLFNTTSVSCSGTSPNLSGMKITGIRIYGQIPSGSANMRMGVYTGGTADNDPTGATLLWDAGETTVHASDGLHWIEITHPSGGADWPPNTRTWLCWKDAAAITYANELDSAAPPGAAEVVGDFNPNVGRHNNTISSDPAATFPSAYPAGGSFNNQYWYMINVSYTTEDAETNCSDGIDNDGDGDTDCLDSDCDGEVCNDGVDCTENDICSGSVCGGTPNDAICNDNNLCTDDTCTAGIGCQYINNTDPCDDTLFCNGADTCVDGTCSQHSGYPCISPEVCNEATNSCEVPPECVIDEDCDDGLFCNGAETCVAYTCQPGIPVVCPDDGLFCNGTEFCNEATDACAGTGDPCTEGTFCNEGTYSCDVIECTNDDDCDDGLYCNGDETCVVYICQPGIPVVCPDDGLFCNGAEFCNEAAKACASSGDPCTQLLCDEANDQCIELIDSDGDGVPDIYDNCPGAPNPGQEDSYPPGGNNIGDACDCEGDFDCDGNVDGTDAFLFKSDFGRNARVNPCSTASPCSGDFDCDGNVDGSDALLFKTDFGRNLINNPCPACVIGDWCDY